MMDAGAARPWMTHRSNHHPAPGALPTKRNARSSAQRSLSQTTSQTQFQSLRGLSAVAAQRVQQTGAFPRQSGSGNSPAVHQQRTRTRRAAWSQRASGRHTQPQAVSASTPQRTHAHRTAASRGHTQTAGATRHSRAARSKGQVSKRRCVSEAQRWHTGIATGVGQQPKPANWHRSTVARGARWSARHQSLQHGA